MLRKTVLVLILASIGFGYFVSTTILGSGTATGPVEVVLTDNGFVPKEVTIPVGTTITFSTDVDRPFWPATNLHPEHSIYPEFDPRQPIPPEESWQFTFDRVGTWKMHDHIRSYYTGVIYVTE